jgi:hypothetical protein
MWYVGLEWADTHHNVEVPYLAGKRVGVRRFAHSHQGLNELKQFVLSIATDRAAGVHCRNQSWQALHLPAGSRHPRLSRQSEDG